MLEINRVYQGDCLELMESIDDNSIDAVITDPPYELGFMGKSWDSTGVANNVEVWKSCLRVLKPGSYLLSFGGTRTYHRMACAIEDAGFEIRDMIEWIYGSGFPKSLDISKAIDKMAGAEREVDTRLCNCGAFKNTHDFKKHSTKNASLLGNKFNEPIFTKPSTPSAIQWQGWGTALKPSHEPVLWAIKPLTTVPFCDMLLSDKLIGGLLCQTLNVSFVEKNLKLSQNELEEEQSFVQWLVDKLNIAKNTEQLPKMDMFKSQEMEKIYLSIVLLWNSLLEENYLKQNTSTISMEINKIIDWKILNSILLVNIYQNIIQAKESDINGLKQFVLGAERNLKEEKLNLTNIQNVIVPENVSLPLLKNVLKEFVVFVEKNLITKELLDYTVQQLAIINQQENVNHEPICMARKPLSEKTVAENVLKYGTGGINIDECRVETLPRNTHRDRGFNKQGSKINKTNIGYNEGRISAATNLGRFPANLIHDGSDVVMAEFEKYGILKSGSKPGHIGKHNINYKPIIIENAYNDSGTPARFFYCAKASKSERDMGCEGLEEKGNLSSVGFNEYRWCDNCNKMIAESSSETRPNSRCFCDSKNRKETTKKAERKYNKNNHPTVKPIKLMEYLIKLVTTEKAIVLDPFAGSGSTLIACRNLDRNFIGIEKEADYVDIANKRIADFKQQLVLV